MRSISKILCLPAGALALLAFFGGCGGGFSQDDAIDYCDVEKGSKAACFNDASYNACVACFQECGDKCAAAESCPETYVCPL